MEQSLRERARALAARILDGGKVPPGKWNELGAESLQWAVLAGEELQDGALSEVKAERAKAARAESMRAELAGLLQKADEAQSVISEVSAINVRLDAEEVARQARAAGDQSLMRDNPEAWRARVAERAGRDIEIEEMKARHEAEITRVLQGRRYSAALSQRDTAWRLANELKARAAAEGIAL